MRLNVERLPEHINKPALDVKALQRTCRYEVLYSRLVVLFNYASGYYAHQSSTQRISRSVFNIRNFGPTGAP